MTWRRLVNRNGLADGGYGEAPSRWQLRCIPNGTEATLADEEETKLARFDTLATRVAEYERAAMMLAGDVRRLESDMVDELALCYRIAARSGVDAEVVAVVLKAFAEE